MANTSGSNITPAARLFGFGIGSFYQIRSQPVRLGCGKPARGDFGRPKSPAWDAVVRSIPCLGKPRSQ
jgi:hypothetical protein